MRAIRRFLGAALLALALLPAHGAQFFLSHAGETTSTTPPANFTERGDADGNYGTDTDVAEHVASGANNYAWLSWDTPGTSISGAGEILVRLRTNSMVGNNSGVCVRCSTSAVSGYVITLAGSGTTLQISRIDAGSEATFTDAAFTAVADTWYWIRARHTGTAVEAKAWADGAGEPGSWTVTLSDTTYSSGFYGYAARYGFADAQWSQIGVGTAGDSAPASTPSSGAPSQRTTVGAG